MANGDGAIVKSFELFGMVSLKKWFRLINFQLTEQTPMHLMGQTNWNLQCRLTVKSYREHQSL